MSKNNFTKKSNMMTISPKNNNGANTANNNRNRDLTKKNSLSILFLFILLSVFSLFYFLFTKNQNNIKKNPSSFNNNLQKKQASPLINPDASLNKSGSFLSEKETLCFSFKFPKGAIVTDDDSCLQEIENFRDLNFFKITIEPEFLSKRIQSLEDMVKYRSTKYEEIDKKNITVDDKEAVYLEEKDNNSSIKTHVLTTFVFIPDKYQYKNIDINGFTISAIFNEYDYSLDEIEKAKKYYQEIINSLTWK